jgi:hypothetical protein
MGGQQIGEQRAMDLLEDEPTIVRACLPVV